MAILEATTSVADLNTHGERQVRLETTSHVWNVSNGTPEEILVSANGSGLAVDDRIIMDLDIYYEDLDASECTANATNLSGTGTYDAGDRSCVVTGCFTQTSPDNSSIATPQDISTEVLAAAKIYQVTARAKTQDAPVITDEVTISRIVEGSNVYGGTFSNGAHSVPNDKDNVLNFTGSSTTFTGYYGTEKLAYTTDANPSEGFFNVTNLVYSSGITGPAVVSDTEGVLFGNITAWTAGSGTAGSRTFDAKARGTGSPESTTFVGLQQTLTKVSDGASGLNGSTMTSGVTAPSNSAGSVGDFYLDTAIERMYEKTGASTWSTAIDDLGGTDGADPDVRNWIFQDKATNPGKPADNAGIPSGWLDDSPASTTYLMWTTEGVQTAGTGNFVWGNPIQLTGDTGPPGNPGGAGGPGPDGDRGAGVYSKIITGSIWSDSEALLALTDEGAGSPRNGDRVTLTNENTNFVETKYYSGGSWNAVTELIDGNLIVTGSILTEDIENNDSDTNGFRLGQSSFDANTHDFGAGSTAYTIKSTASFTSNTNQSLSPPEGGGSGVFETTILSTQTVNGAESASSLAGCFLQQNTGDFAAAALFTKYNGSTYVNTATLSTLNYSADFSADIKVGGTLFLGSTDILTLIGSGGGGIGWDGTAIVSPGSELTARTSLGLGTAATTAATDYATSNHLHTGVYADAFHGHPFADISGVATTDQLTTGSSNDFTITSGTVSAGDFQATSDRAAKHSIAELEADRAMEALGSIKPVSFIKKDTEKSSIGFIAQDVEEFYPDLVGQGDEFKSLNYAQMTAILWKQNQELLKRIEKLEGESNG
jgi:hypothetical protein